MSSSVDQVMKPVWFIVFGSIVHTRDGEGSCEGKQLLYYAHVPASRLHARGWFAYQTWSDPWRMTRET